VLGRGSSNAPKGAALKLFQHTRLPFEPFSCVCHVYSFSTIS
jgi:hypothetical protein